MMEKLFPSPGIEPLVAPMKNGFEARLFSSQIKVVFDLVNIGKDVETHLSHIGRKSAILFSHKSALRPYSGEGVKSF